MDEKLNNLIERIFTDYKNDTRVFVKYLSVHDYAKMEFDYDLKHLYTLRMKAVKVR
ncbi:MAG: hypothetical protein ABIA37_00060 [Candidatus Woesearchaeota archaeon]